MQLKAKVEKAVKEDMRDQSWLRLQAQWGGGQGEDRSRKERW